MTPQCAVTSGEKLASIDDLLGLGMEDTISVDTQKEVETPMQGGDLLGLSSSMESNLPVNKATSCSALTTISKDEDLLGAFSSQPLACSASCIDGLLGDVSNKESFDPFSSPGGGIAGNTTSNGAPGNPCHGSIPTSFSLTAANKYSASAQTVKQGRGLSLNSSIGAPAVNLLGDFSVAGMPVGTQPSQPAARETSTLPVHRDSPKDLFATQHLAPGPGNHYGNRPRSTSMDMLTGGSNAAPRSTAVTSQMGSVTHPCTPSLPRSAVDTSYTSVIGGRGERGLREQSNIGEYNILLTSDLAL